MNDKTYSVVRNAGRAGQSLGDGQVATSTDAIYTSPSSLYTLIRSCCFYNTNAATQTLDVYVTRSGGTRRQLYQVSLAQYESFNMVSAGEVFSLSPADALEASTTTTTAVDYLLTGQTEDAQ